MGKYVIKQAKSGYKFNLHAANGEIIAVSQLYSAKPSCLNGVESVRKNAPTAEIEDQTIADYETLKHPKFELYKDKAGEFRFRLKASNGEIILASEGYTAKASCKNGIASVKRNAPDSQVIEEEEK